MELEMWGIVVNILGYCAKIDGGEGFSLHFKDLRADSQGTLHDHLHGALYVL